MKHHGNTLRSILQERDINIAAFGTEYLGLSRPATYNLLSRKEFKRAYLSLVCQLLNLSPTAFGERHDIFQMSDQPMNMQKGKLKFVSTYDIKSIEAKSFIKEKYFRSISENISQTTKHLFVYDYFSRNKKIEQVKDYHRAHQGYLDGLRDVLEKNKDREGFCYQRIIAMPLNMPSHHGSKSLLEQLVLYAFRETFHHIYELLCKYPQNFELYILSAPQRLFSYLIADDEYTQVHISEFDRYENMVAMPDTVFIDRTTPNAPKDPVKDIVRSFRSEFKAMIDRCQAGYGNQRVHAHHLRSALKGLNDFYSSEREMDYEPDQARQILLIREDLKKKDTTIRKIDNMLSQR